jgi:hypothetical protein
LRDRSRPQSGSTNRSLDFARDLACGLPFGSLPLASLTPAKRLDFTKLYARKKAVLLDNHRGNPQHPTQWEKSIKTQMIQQYNKQIL